MLEDKQLLPTTLEDLVQWLGEVYPETQTIAAAEQSAYEQGVLHGKVLIIEKIKEINNNLKEI